MLSLKQREDLFPKVKTGRSVRVTPSNIFVWDTSSLSHAFEDFMHAVKSAYESLKTGDVTWERLKKSLSFRLSSEENSRRLLLRCATTPCYTSSSVKNELERVKPFRGITELIYGMSNGRLSAVFRPRLRIWRADRREVENILSVAKRLGQDISYADAEGIALAKKLRGYLVTADIRQARVARHLGVPVVFTPKEKI